MRGAFPDGCSDVGSTSLQGNRAVAISARSAWVSMPAAPRSGVASTPTGPQLHSPSIPRDGLAWAAHRQRRVTHVYSAPSATTAYRAGATIQVVPQGVGTWAMRSCSVIESFRQVGSVYRTGLHPVSSCLRFHVRTHVGTTWLHRLRQRNDETGSLVWAVFLYNGSKACFPLPACDACHYWKLMVT